MKNTIYGAILFIALIFTINGCGGGGSTATKTYTAGTINYADGSVFGITKEEASINGVFNIYDIKSINTLIGFISMDGVVTDINGLNIGVCSGASISDRGVSGSCNVPIANSSNGTSLPAACEQRRLDQIEHCVSATGIARRTCESVYSSENWAKYPGC